MARGQKVVAVVAFLIHGLMAVCAEDLFPTYRDEDWEEEARNGVVSLSPSSNSMNYTLNLSGFLMLGLGVAAATMFWAHASSLGRKKRSLYEEQDVSLPAMMAYIHRQFDEAEIREVSCRQRVICEASNAKGLTIATFGSAISNFFNSVESSDWLKTQVEADKWAKIYFSAWNQGKKGVKSCKAIFAQCSFTPDSIKDILNHAE